MEIRHHYFTTNDGVRLHYTQAGENNERAMVCVHGWAQSADSFKFQLQGLGDRYRMIALDLRGHGESEKSSYGYSMFRLAKDVHDLLHALNLNDVILVGHSMGCAVAWAYWTLFRSERLEKFVFVDEMAAVAGNPFWTEEEKLQKGPIFGLESLYKTYGDLIGPNGKEASAAFVAPMFTETCPPELLERALVESAKLPVKTSAALLLNHCLIDWTDEIRTITLPTLVVNGEDSHVPPPASAWIAEAIPGARLETFLMNESARHFMFLENPEKFNTILAEFAG